MHDPVNSPKHYASGAIECIEAIEASMGLEAYKGFLKGNILKYVWRYETKGGVESLQKAQWYLNRLVSAVETENEEKMKFTLDPSVIKANYDPDDYMVSGCPDNFCPLPGVRQGPSEPMFPLVN